jgi:hypothetical protein
MSHECQLFQEDLASVNRAGACPAAAPFEPHVGAANPCDVAEGEVCSYDGDRAACYHEYQCIGCRWFKTAWSIACDDPTSCMEGACLDDRDCLHCACPESPARYRCVADGAGYEECPACEGQ